MYSSVPSAPQQWSSGPLPNLERTRTATSPTPASPTSPRTGRLRGLSYLRSYTQNHILSRDSHHSPNNTSNTSQSQAPSRPTTSRATSYPSPTSRGSAGPASPASPTSVAQQPPTSASPTAQRYTSELPSASTSSQNNIGGTSGWVPTVGGQSAVSRIASEPTTSTASAILAGNTSTIMARTRSATTGTAPDHAQGQGEQPSTESRADPSIVNGHGAAHGTSPQLPSIRFSAHQDPRAQRPSLVFPPMSRILPQGDETIKVGRYSERDNAPIQAVNVPSSAPVGFKSKVVSRRHCEFWCSGGRWFIKDVKSSSGTFLNHIRLSSPGTESRPFPVNDGDIVQLGIDFKGGEEMIFRCVKIRVELNKGWQTGPSSFNVQSHKRLRELNNLGKPPAAGSSQDCSICLGPIAPCQSLFVAPCSHTWHYKCIRVIINGPHWPHFICPNCRTVADLEAELDDPYANGEWEEVEAEESAPAVETPNPQESAPAVQPVKPSGVTDTPFESGVLVEAQDLSEPERSDMDMPDTGSDSGPEQTIQRATEEMGYLNIEPEHSPPNSAAGLVSSRSTSAPVNIVRKALSSNNSNVSQAGSFLDRHANRTPSPNAAGVEGPMTPRNDAGPFIFDGSAGRIASARAAEVASMNLNEAANTPPAPTSHPA